VENFLSVAKWVRSGQVVRSGLDVKEGNLVKFVRREPCEEDTWKYK